MSAVAFAPSPIVGARSAAAHETLWRYAVALMGGEPRASLLEIRPLAPGGGAAAGRAWMRLDRLEEAAERILELAPRAHVYVGVAPRVRAGGTARDVERVWTLWVDCDTPEAVARLEAFRPAPAIVVGSGSGGAHGYWPLRRPLTPEDARRANRRLARALGADVKATDPARILRPPGTLNHKHEPPRPVVCTRLSERRVSARSVVGELPDSARHRRPPPRAQRARIDTEDHAERALDGLAGVVAGAAEGCRSDLTFWALCRAFEHIDAGEMRERDALDALSGAALSTGLPGSEVRATIASARRTTRGAS